MHDDLCECTGFAGMSLQPNSGAQGEYAGLMVIKAFHESRGDHQRNLMIIPSSAHGTNPASAVMAGFKVVVTSCDENGNINVDELKKVAEEHKDTLGGLMVTYPSTHGVYEEAIKEIRSLREDFYKNVSVPGSSSEFNEQLAKAGRVADFLELGELFAKDALDRTESCGGHFREESQTPEGEALRDDKNFSFSSAWEYNGEPSKAKLHKEQLKFEAIEVKTRSYK